MSVDNKVPISTQLASSEVGKVVQPEQAKEPPKAPEQPAAKPAEPIAEKQWAGKYANKDELVKGTRHIWEHLGLGKLSDGELVGEGKQWPSYEAMEQSYQNAERLSRQRKAEEREPTILDEPKAKEPEVPKDEWRDVPVGELLSKAQISQADLELAVSSNRLDDAMCESIRRVHPTLSQMAKPIAYELIRAKATLAVQQLHSTREAAYAAAGGKEQLKAMLDSMVDIVPSSELPSLKAVINNPATTLIGIRDLKSRYESATRNATGSPAIVGSSAGVGGSVSDEEFAEARKTVFKLASRPDSPDFKKAVEIVSRAKVTSNFKRVER